MRQELSGKHLLAGKWVRSEVVFESDPVDGPKNSFSVGSAEDVDVAAEAAEAAFWSYGNLARGERAAFLNQIAEEIDARGADITEIGCQETGLPEARLEGERGRTIGQLRLFAQHILNDGFLDRRHDEALPDRQPLPRADIKLLQRPIGPVAVFGASNFPLAFSTAGGDTASALAAGCPVIVKGHPAHPGTSEIVAQAIHAAIKACGIHPGVFSLIQGDGYFAGQALVKHALVKAVGFTGSLSGGRAIFDLCAARAEPIPCFAEMGSVNPIFLMPAALSSRGEALAKDWVGSLTLGAGQFCTNPGICFVIDSPHTDSFIETVKSGLQKSGLQTMLSNGISNAYRQGVSWIKGNAEVQQLVATSCDQRNASPSLFVTTGKTWQNDETLGDEVFGPLGLIVRLSNFDEMLVAAHALCGQLTCTLLMDEEDTEKAAALLPVLERKAGRILANGMPTGVEVCDAMVHGGPYPASTNFGATSVGTMAVRRFLRPVCYQNIPQSLLPSDLSQ